MERNPNDPIGTSGTGAGASPLGTSGMGTTAGTDSLGTAGQGAGIGTTSGGTAGQASSGLGDRLGQARTAATEKLGQAREKATELKSSLADRLEAGATSLRQQAQGTGGPQLAVADATAAAAAGSDHLARLATPAADALQKSADFLRDGDLKATLENQIRTNPARTLLVAVGLGYLLGKTLRRDH